MSMSGWAKREIEIAKKRERGDAPEGEWDYGCACYDSALKAFNSLLEDGHSGYSISITKQILVRLIDGKPLTPIEDTEDVWRGPDVFHDPDFKSYQCMRMTSLFKHVYPDGTVEYNDVDRFYCEDKNTGSTYTTGVVGKIINELWPITFPYCGEEKIKVVCEDFLTDEKNGDVDTLGVFYAIRNGEKVKINRFFKSVPNGWEKISMAEYEERSDERIERK